MAKTARDTRDETLPPAVEEPTEVGTSQTYHRGPVWRRYLGWFGFVLIAINMLWGAQGILMGNQVQTIEFPNYFTGADANVDLFELQQLRDEVSAGTATPTSDQDRQLQALADYDAGRAQSLALVASVSTILTMLIAPIVGVLSDRTRSKWGRRAPWILFGGLAGAAFLVGVRYSPNIPLLIVSYMFVGAALTMATGPLQTTVADRVPHAKRGAASGIAGFAAFFGGVVGGVGAGIGFAFLGLDIYLVFAFLIALAVTGFVLFVRDRSSKDLEVAPHNWGEFFRGFLVPLRARDFRLVFIARVVLIFGYSLSTALSLYMLQSYVRPAMSAAEATAAAPLLIFAGMPFTVIAMLIAGALSDKLGRRKPFVIVASILMAIGLLIPFVSATFIGLIVSGIVVGFAFGIYLPVDQALFVDVLPDLKSAGRDLGVAGLGSSVGQAVGPILAGQIVALTGSYALIWPVAAVLAAAAAFVIIPVRGAK